MRVLGKGEKIGWPDRRFEVEPIVIEGLNHAVNFGIEFFRQQEVAISCMEKEVKLVTGSKGQERLTRLCSAYGKPLSLIIKGRRVDKENKRYTQILPAVWKAEKWELEVRRVVCLGQKLGTIHSMCIDKQAWIKEELRESTVSDLDEEEVCNSSESVNSLQELDFPTEESKRKFIKDSFKIDENKILNRDAKLKEEVINLFLENFSTLALHPNHYGKTDLLIYWMLKGAGRCKMNGTWESKRLVWPIILRYIVVQARHHSLQPLDGKG